MLRVLGALGALTFALSPLHVGRHTSRAIYVKTLTPAVSTATLRDDAPAFQRAAEQYESVWHDSYAWGRTVIKVLEPDEPIPPNSWYIIVVNPDDLNCVNCLGFHDVEAGRPYAEVGTLHRWAITFTHELFEMLKDPYMRSFHRVGYRNYLVEVADPVENDGLFYTLRTRSGRRVRISDFVTPAWYRPGASGPYDWMHKTKRPLQLLPGGYVSWQDRAGEWHQAFG